MVFFVLLIFVLALAAFALLFRALLQRSRPGAFDPLQWLDDFCPTMYHPMERLLDGRDSRFLASQAGFAPQIARHLRRQRIGIFQVYLWAMINDFRRLQKMARLIAVYSGQGQPAFSEELWRLQWSFYASVFAVEIHVVLHWIGLGTVDAGRLVSALERIEGYTQQLIPATA